jgi:hypothetical protein
MPSQLCPGWTLNREVKLIRSFIFGFKAGIAARSGLRNFKQRVIIAIGSHGLPLTPRLFIPIIETILPTSSYKGK